MTTEIQTFELIKEQGEWKIFFDWEAQRQIDSLKNLAEKFEKEKNFEKAIESYKKIIETDSSSIEAKNAVEKVKALQEERKEWGKKKGYFDKVIIKNVRIRESYFGETGVFGEVKNTGDKTLNEVEITIYCLDKSGNAIFEKNYHPVLVSEYSFSNNEPLKPNYSRKFGVKLDDAPSDWARKVKVEVTDIEFSE